MITETFLAAALFSNGTFDATTECKGISKSAYDCKMVTVMRKEIVGNVIKYIDPKHCGDNFKVLPLFVSYSWHKFQAFPFPKVTCKDDDRGDGFKLGLSNDGWKKEDSK